MYRLIVLLAVVLAPSSHAQVYKCQGADGRVVYSGLPCSPATKQVEAPNLTNAAGRSDAMSPSAGIDLSPLPPIDFGPDKGTQLRRAVAMVASIRVDARDCDWDLKVTRKYDRCSRFLGQMVEGREWSQAMQKLADLAGDVDIATRHQAELSEALRDAEEISKVKEFALIRVGR